MKSRLTLAAALAALLAPLPALAQEEEPDPAVFGVYFHCNESKEARADTIVAETFMDGDITPLNVANLLSAQPGDIPQLMLKGEGDRVEEGEPIARNKGVFGMFKSQCTAPASGTLETISKATGQIMIRGESIPVQVKAYLAGTVTEVLPDEGVVVENQVTLIQGIFGVGGETSAR